jgi:hypothetical protein
VESVYSSFSFSTNYKCRSKYLASVSRLVKGENSL